MNVVEWGAVRETVADPVYQNLAKVFLPARWLTACEFVGGGVKMAEWS